MFGRRKNKVGDEEQDNDEALGGSRFNTANFEPTGAVGEPTPKAADAVPAAVKDLLGEVQDAEDTETSAQLDADDAEDDVVDDSAVSQEAPRSSASLSEVRRLRTEDGETVDPWLSDILEAEETQKRKREEFKQYQGHFARLNDFPVAGERFGRTQVRDASRKLDAEVELKTDGGRVFEYPSEDEESVTLRPREVLSASMYDDLINWQSRLIKETPLFHRAFSTGKVATIADVGCGSGRHSILFAQWGKRVMGIDGNPGALKVARALAEESRDSIEVAKGSVDFKQGDLGSITSVVGPECVEAIVCVDDVLPRIGSLTGLREALDDFASALLPSGILILEFANHTHFVQRRIRTTSPAVFDTTEGKKVFLKVMDYPAASTVINTDTLSLTCNDKGRWHVRSQKSMDLFISPEGIERELLSAGFDLLEISGDYSGKPLDRLEDEIMIVIARRKRHRPNR